MIKILVLLLLTGCANGAQFGSQVVIEPIDAIRICGGEIKTYSALTGKIECKDK